MKRKLGSVRPPASKLPRSDKGSAANLPPPHQTPTKPPPINRLPGSANLPNLEFNQSEIKLVVQEAASSVAQKMGIPPSALSTEIKDAIRVASENALATRTNALIQRDVDAAVKATLLRGTKPLDALNDRVTAAMEGISHVAQDAKIDSVLADTARLLWKKFQALKTAGFTETQAFDLVLAEVQGRASRNS